MKASSKDYVCPKCFHRIKECTCPVSPWSLINIDRNIQKHIRILNEKGYKTVYCCESHKPTENMYISFAHDYHFKAPDGFKKHKNLISFMYPASITSYEEFIEQKQKHLDSLLEWCESLRSLSC